MGSKISKAVRRSHVNAAASVCASSAPSPNNERETGPRQASQLLDIKCEQPLVNHTFAQVATSWTEHDNPFSPRPADDADAMEIETRPRESTGSRSASLLAGLQELPGDIFDYNPPPPPTDSTVVEQTVIELSPLLSPHPEPSLACIICGDHFAKNEEHTAIKPCSRCSSPYCMGCLKTMFVDACTDMSRMPPKCCIQVPLHHARPYLTQEEVILFRAKYEEWSTPNPFYCPVARCSAFIPERLLPRRRTNHKGKQRVDSGVGTPTSSVIACPSCEADICVDCRNLAHANATCDPLEFGIDKETAELLRIWGYKRCPKCGNGLKRMFGCNHMECRCGAHFCWVCLKNQETGCDGGCYDGNEDNYSDDEPDEEEDEERSQPEDTNDMEIPASADSAVVQTVEEIHGAEGTQSTEESTPRVRNLDGGSARYWEEADYDFGDEPTDNVQDRAWDCHHEFATAKVSLTDSLRNVPSATGMECMKCWGAIHPEIEMPNNINSGGVKTITSMASGRSLRGRGRARGRGRLQPYPRRNPFRVQPDAVFGSSAPELTSHSQPMEGIQYNPFIQPASAGSERIVDTYGNTITTTETPSPTRRASLDAVMLDEHHRDDPVPEWMIDGLQTISNNATTRQKSLVPVHKHSSINLATSTSPFSFAYHCDDCGLLVCNTCKDNLLAAIKDESGEGNEDNEEAVDAS